MSKLLGKTWLYLLKNNDILLISFHLEKLRRLLDKNVLHVGVVSKISPTLAPWLPACCL